MFDITITPYFRPRRPGGLWTGRFETIPSIRVLARTVARGGEALTKGMVDGTLPSTEGNVFLRDAVHPKCQLILGAPNVKIPVPDPKGRLKIHTIIRGEKVLGDIAIKETT